MASKVYALPCDNEEESPARFVLVDTAVDTGEFYFDNIDFNFELEMLEELALSKPP